MDNPCAICGTTGIYDTTSVCRACYFENKTEYLKDKIKQLEDILEDVFIWAKQRDYDGCRNNDERGFAKKIIGRIPVELLSGELQKTLEGKDGVKNSTSYK